MSQRKHRGSIRDFRWYDSLRTIEVPDPVRSPSHEQTRIFQLRATLYQIREIVENLSAETEADEKETILNRIDSELSTPEWDLLK